MKFIETLKLAISAIWAHKLRSALTLLGLIIGVMAVATWAAHRHNGFFIFNPGQGWEYTVSIAVVAWAALVAVEEEAVTLDQPAGPEGSTVRHLLAHASGLAYDVRKDHPYSVYDRFDFDVVHGHDWLVASAGDHLAKRFRVGPAPLGAKELGSQAAGTDACVRVGEGQAGPAGE